jgi:DNA polymerase-3 subunit gamma/tau
MVDALAAGDAAAVYATVDRIVQAGHDPRRFAADLLDRFRDLIVLDAVPDAAERGLIDEPEDQLAHMGDQAIRIGGAALTRYAEIVHTALLEMRGTTSARLVLELLCARMQLPDAAVDSAALLQRLERLERRASLVSESAAAADPLPAPPARETGGKTGRAAPAPAPASPPPASGARPAEVRPAPQTSAADSPAGATTDSPAAAPARPRAPWPEPPSAVPPSAVPAPDSGSGESGMPATGVSGGVAPASSVSGQLDAAALRRLWPEILEIVKQASRRTRALLDNAQISDVAGELVTLAAPPALARMIADDSNTSILREALTKVVGGSWRIVTEPENAASSRRAEPAAGDSAGQPAGSRGSGRSFDDDPRDDGDYEPSSTAERTPPADPEAEAIKLLTDQLGAQPLEET